MRASTWTTRARASSWSIQSKTKTVDDPAFRATINDTLDSLAGFEQVTMLHSPLAPGNEGQISPDRHSVLIIFSPHGTYLEAALYIDTIVAATAKVQKAHPDFYVAEAGVSTEKALDKVINSGIAKAGLIALVLTLVILLLLLGSAVAAVVPILVGLTAVFATFGLVALPSQLVPMDGSGQRGHPPDRARRRRRLLALLPPPRA